MTNKNILSDVTVVMPCYNEGVSIADTIKYLKSVGFKNILIIDDNSVDDTYFILTKEKVSVLRNRRKIGFNLSLLKGLYDVKTKHAFVVGPIGRFEKDSLLDFICFGIKGNYSLLFGKSKRKQSGIFSINIAPLLRERYGINIPKPLLDVAFINESLLNKIKTETISDDFIFLELVRIVMKNDLKLGTYDLEMEHPSHYTHFRSLMNLFLMQLRTREYLRRAFPKKYKESIRNKVITNILIAVIGYLIIRLIEFVLSNFIQKA
jgi:glycosyltransferase involved in cell wall biosynthesis